MLLSGDLMVADPDATAQLLVERLGLIGHPNWRQAFPNHPYVAHFLRTHKSLAVAPTRIEPQGHTDQPNHGDPMFPVYLHSLEQFQGPGRPIKTHATVLISDDLTGVAQRLFERRLPFRVAQVTPEMPFDRLWVGCTPEDPRYLPEVDGGLCIEIMGLDPLQMPADTFATPPPEPRDPEPGSLVRVVARGFLVRDSADVTSRLHANLDWEPAPTESFPDEGFRRVRMGFALPHSAALDLIEPTRWDGEAGKFLCNWGPGPYYIRISVNGLDAKADQLERAGTRFTLDKDSASAGGSMLRVDPQDVGGAIFEFVEHRP
ncbi:MAG: hypothetical protein QOJ03_3264 [Frankiaceae bacterium]|jgi:hypothetical protein|nr:hypothetical protein [Frankiaceae bacterium]